MTDTFKKVIVWGHKLGDPRTSNTFSFIHDSWIKTFKHMGYDTLWLDNNDDISSLNFDNCLFLTEGQVDQKMPINNTSKYVLHNCNLDKYRNVISNCLNLQVYTKDCLTREVQSTGEKFVYYQPKPNYDRPDHGCDNRTIYQTWATNLLPNEIDPDKLMSVFKYPKQGVVYWVGSVCDGHQGNINELNRMAQALGKFGIQFIHAKIENDSQPQAIQISALAPAVQGAWQVDKHYIPCRVFKNISFGRMPLTNNPIMKELFDDKMIYSNDMNFLIEEGLRFEINTDNKSEKIMKELIVDVKQNHTYINRINSILKVL